ncbi:hypothetical protein CH380_14610 [Leptospira adleri]|uniref:Uncharacterized protein n=1 Tax=Leptospira adleri TaxID=2023186 RepID=A0A2M9YLH5_9LEPT|nr:hypothetical protein CH380_14610 [Leptospira adleri]PJZ60143.1 hypothetical protein CH376_19890 [Leptospira adleri]
MIRDFFTFSNEFRLKIFPRLFPDAGFAQTSLNRPLGQYKRIVSPYILNAREDDYKRPETLRTQCPLFLVFSKKKNRELSKSKLRQEKGSESHI